MPVKQGLAIRVLSGLIALVGLMLLGASMAKPVHADTPPPDYPCRECHGDSQRELTFPSGETLSLKVPLDALDASVHGSGAESPLLCTDCHTGDAHYRYPHDPNPAQNPREFIAAVSQKCESCHYPHDPLHGDLAPSLELPTCADCHGSHDIAPISDIPARMPDACVSCHTDQTRAWAAHLMPVSVGVGVAAAGYVGSNRCAGCHDMNYYGWRNTLHAKTIQDPSTDPGAVVGDFSRDDPARTFSLDQVTYTIGSRRVQRYLQQDENGNLQVLPAQWNVAAGKWEPYTPEGSQDWSQSCSFCHVTGLNTNTWGFSEFGVSCESCHGPGAAHVANPTQVKPYAQVDDQVCGSCHSRGTSSQGHPFPATYRPGDQLADHFTFTTSEEDIWPDGSAKKNAQQYMDWQLGNSMAQTGSIHCVTCHTVHGSGAGPAQVRAAGNELCLDCHGDKRNIVQHIPYHEHALTTRDFACTDCHMPKMATNAPSFGSHNHSFLQPAPQASVQHGLEAMPNACNLCHGDEGESPTWAAQTIAYAVQIATPIPASVFGPGPTPTSPPPPTPIPSVGEPVQVEKVVPGRWLRVTAYVIFGMVLVGLAYLIYRAVRSQRWSNA